QLVKALEGATSQHERATALVNARNGLLPRLSLSRHPGLPQAVRDELEAQFVRDIEGLQSQLEEQATRANSHNASSNRNEQEATLRLIHRTRLTAILEPGYVATVSESQPPVTATVRTVATTGAPPPTTLNEARPRH